MLRNYVGGVQRALYLEIIAEPSKEIPADHGSQCLIESGNASLAYRLMLPTLYFNCGYITRISKGRRSVVKGGENPSFRVHDKPSDSPFTISTIHTKNLKCCI